MQNPEVLHLEGVERVVLGAAAFVKGRFGRAQWNQRVAVHLHPAVFPHQVQGVDDFRGPVDQPGVSVSQVIQGADNGQVPLDGRSVR